jgi:hypothetical protein
MITTYKGMISLSWMSDGQTFIKFRVIQGIYGLNLCHSIHLTIVFIL